MDITLEEMAEAGRLAHARMFQACCPPGVYPSLRDVPDMQRWWKTSKHVGESAALQKPSVQQAAGYFQTQRLPQRSLPDIDSVMDLFKKDFGALTLPFIDWVQCAAGHFTPSMLHFMRLAWMLRFYIVTAMNDEREIKLNFPSDRKVAPPRLKS